MRKLFSIATAAAFLSACGKGETSKPAAPAKAKKKVGYCFFKDPETKGWAAKRDKDGNIVVKGKAYRSDARYKAILNPATITGNNAEITPTIALNDTGFAADGNWWNVSSTIPNSAAVGVVKVICGPKTFADLKVTPKG